MDINQQTVIDAMRRIYQLNQSCATLRRALEDLTQQVRGALTLSATSTLHDALMRAEATLLRTVTTD